MRRHNQPGEQSAALPVRVCNLKQAWGECAATGGSLSQGAAALHQGLSAATTGPLGTLRAKAPHTCPRGTHARKAGDGQWDANRVTADAKVCQGQCAQRGQHAQQHPSALRLRLQGTAPEGAVVKEWWDCYGRLAVKGGTTLADTAAGVHFTNGRQRETPDASIICCLTCWSTNNVARTIPVPTPTCARPATACPSYLEPAAVANLQRPQRAGTPKRGRHCLKAVALRAAGSPGALGRGLRGERRMWVTTSQLCSAAFESIKAGRKGSPAAVGEWHIRGGLRARPRRWACYGGGGRG